MISLFLRNFDLPDEDNHPAGDVGGSAGQGCSILPTGNLLQSLEHISLVLWELEGGALPANTMFHVAKIRIEKYIKCPGTQNKK